MTRPLHGVKIVEFAGLAPAPFAAMMLADHGAEVIRIERAGHPSPIPPDKDILRRSRARILSLDLKSEEGRAQAREFAAWADGLIEGFRPGVMERLGLGPEVLLKDNPQLVYARMTGWGQEGPLSAAAGHDINYIALAGNLHGYGRAGAKATGRGKVIDCAMVDGAALLAAQTYSLLAAGMWRDERGVNFLDGGAPFYDSYECADAKYVSLGALEPHFFAVLSQKLGLTSSQHDATLREELAATFHTKPRQHWCDLLEGSDACFAPVLSLTEAPAHPHLAARGTFAELDGLLQPMPAPRFKDPN
jgi:alpha-methylacyl-CoA racemase